MKDCTTCGNPIPDTARTCRYCGHDQDPAIPSGGARSQIYTIDLKRDRPTVAEAMELFQTKIGHACLAKARLVRVIHGWGSTGTGGKIRAELRRRLPAWLPSLPLRDWLPGEDLSPATNAGRDWIRRHPALKNLHPTDCENPGQTWLELD